MDLQVFNTVWAEVLAIAQTPLFQVAVLAFVVIPLLLMMLFKALFFRPGSFENTRDSNMGSRAKGGVLISVMWFVLHAAGQAIVGAFTLALLKVFVGLDLGV